MKKILILIVLLLGFTVNSEDVLAMNDNRNTGVNSETLPRAYIYLTQTQRDMEGVINVTATLVVTENPKTAELEIYDVKDIEIEARNGENVYGVDIDYIAISSTKKGVEVFFSYYNNSGKNNTTVVYTI